MVRKEILSDQDSIKPLKNKRHLLEEKGWLMCMSRRIYLIVTYSNQCTALELRAPCLSRANWWIM